MKGTIHLSQWSSGWVTSFWEELFWIHVFKDTVKMEWFQVLFLHLHWSLCDRCCPLSWGDPGCRLAYGCFGKVIFAAVLQVSSLRGSLSWLISKPQAWFSAPYPVFFSFPAEVFHQLSQALAVLTDTAARVRIVVPCGGRVVGCNSQQTCWRSVGNSLLVCPALFSSWLHECESCLFYLVFHEIKLQVPDKNLGSCSLSVEMCWQ